LVATTETRFKLEFVWLLIAMPSLRQMKLNGPVPVGVVANVAAVPGQLVRLVNEVADVFVLTVSVAELVTLLQIPETMTE
jgi:hypothetical protein